DGSRLYFDGRGWTRLEWRLLPGRRRSRGPSHVAGLTWRGLDWGVCTIGVHIHQRSADLRHESLIGYVVDALAHRLRLRDVPHSARWLRDRKAIGLSLRGETLIAVIERNWR